MPVDVPEMSPLLLNTIGGLVAILFIIGIIYALTKFTKVVKDPVPGPADIGANGGACVHSQLFTDVRDAAIGAKSAALRNEKTLGILVETLSSMDKSLLEIKTSSKNQEELLKQLVSLRTKFVKAQ